MSDETPTEAVADDEACVLAHPANVARYVGLLCRRDYHRLSGALAEIVELYALLPDTLLPGSGDDIRSGKQVYAPAPGNLDTAAITDPRAETPNELVNGDDVPSVPRTLTTWCEHVALRRNLSPPLWRPRAAPAGAACKHCSHPLCIVIRHRGLPYTAGDFRWYRGAWRLKDDVASQVRMLRRELGWIAQQLWVEDFTTEIQAVHRHVARAARATMWPESIGACPNCQQPLFNNMTGADEVTCRRCKSSWSGVAYLRLRLIHDQDREKRA